MVQGGNTRVNMNVGAATQAGSALAKLGQTLAQTGQDVSKIMEVTVEAQEKTDLIRAKQKWKEIQAKQSIFEEKNKRDPLLWDANRQKLMKEFDAYNSEMKTYTKNGSLNLQLNKEAWASDFKYNTLKGMQKRINMNLADETIASVKTSLANKNPAEAEMALRNGETALTKEAYASAQISIKQGYQDLKMSDEKDFAQASPKDYLFKLSKRTDLNRDEKDKLGSYATQQRNIQAREQLDILEERMNSTDGFSMQDFQAMQDAGELSQVDDGDLAKLQNNMEKGAPLTLSELSHINAILADLPEKRAEMSEEDYLPYYTSKASEIRGLIGTNKSYGFVTNDLYMHNPFYKSGTDNLQAQNIQDNKIELAALAEYHLQRLDFSPQSHKVPVDGYARTWDLLTQDEKEEAQKNQRDLLRKARKHIAKYPDMNETELRSWFGGELEKSKAVYGYKKNTSLQRSGNTQPKAIKNNTFKNRSRMLKNKTLRQQQMDTSTGKVSNKANFGGSSNWTGGNTKEQVEQNLVKIQSPSGAPFRVNKMVAGNFESFLRELEDVVGYPINAESSAGYHWRKKRGKQSLSQHSYGNAIDINWDENKAFWGGEDAISKIPNIDEIAAKHGLVWGGSWKNKDTMQFEYHPSTGVPARGI